MAHASGVKVLISLFGGGGSGPSTLSAAMNSTTARTTLVTNCLNFVAQYGLDGLDLDWEGPQNATEGAAYTSFVQAMYNSLHPQGKLVTTAVASWFGNNVPSASFADPDFLNVMSYDNDGLQHSSYSAGVSEFELLVRKDALHKVMNKFYGYCSI